MTEIGPFWEGVVLFVVAMIMSVLGHLFNLSELTNNVQTVIGVAMGYIGGSAATNAANSKKAMLTLAPKAAA